MLAPHRYGLRSDPARGTYRVWTQPDPERVVVIGADAAGGGAKGDSAAAVVIDAETCAPVATFSAKMRPIPFGRVLARIGWHYNEALLAIETAPSGHGMLAAHTALGLGYPNLYHRRNLTIAWKPASDNLGWATTASTKDMMIGRLQQAVDEGVDLRALELIRELQAQRFDEKGKVECPKNAHDDLMIAFAIALMVRDEGFKQGTLRRPVPAPKTEAERFWADRENRGARRQQQRRVRV